MREIKFRVWDKELEETLTQEEGSFQYRDREDYWMTDLEDAMGNPERFTIMQYTGLKDKNGIEIYEGDIVKRTHLFNGGYGETHTGEVVYDKEYARYVISRPQKHIEPKTEDLRNILSNKSTYEVIANIFENPELLEREAE